MNSVYEEIKKHEPENYDKFKRLENLNYEIVRLNCVLGKGMVSKKIFDKLVLKIDNLENEFLELNDFLIMKPNRENKGLNTYQRNFMDYCHENKKKIYGKFKCKKCEWCDCVIFDEIGYCPDSDCESHQISTDEEDSSSDDE